MSREGVAISGAYSLTAEALLRVLNGIRSLSLCLPISLFKILFLLLYTKAHLSLCVKHCLVT